MKTRIRYREASSTGGVSAVVLAVAALVPACTVSNTSSGGADGHMVETRRDTP